MTTEIFINSANEKVRSQIAICKVQAVSRENNPKRDGEMMR